jgi:hypothetical protein
MITPVKVSTVDAPLTREIEATGSEALDKLDTMWLGSTQRLTFSGWLTGRWNTLIALKKSDWSHIYQLFRPQRIRVGSHTYQAYRFCLLAIPKMTFTRQEDITPEVERRLREDSHLYTCFLVLDHAGKIATIVNPILTP